MHMVMMSGKYSSEQTSEDAFGLDVILAPDKHDARKIKRWSHMLEHHVARNLEDNIEREEELRFLSQFTIANVFLVLPKAFEWAPDLPCSGPVRLTRTAVL